QMILLSWKETYQFDFPSVYGRSILSVPWIELGGNVTVNCLESGFSASIIFHCKRMFGGKKNKISVEIFRPNQNSSFYTVDGEWNGAMTGNLDGRKLPFLDMKKVHKGKKIVRPVSEQELYESRRIWKDVTYSLK